MSHFSAAENILCKGSQVSFRSALFRVCCSDLQQTSSKRRIRLISFSQSVSETLWQGYCKNDFDKLTANHDKNGKSGNWITNDMIILDNLRSLRGSNAVLYDVV